MIGVRLGSHSLRSRVLRRRRIRGEDCALLRRGIGDFAENGWRVRAGGAGEIAGAAVECFVSEECKGEGFFGVFGNAEARRRKNFCAVQGSGELHQKKRVLCAAAGNNELADFCFW